MSPVEEDCCTRFDRMIAPEQALAEAMALKTGHLPMTFVPIARASGLVLAADVFAKADSPPFDASAMDGFAMATRDIFGDGPWTLPIAREVRAGDEPCALAPATAVRVLTGAPMPSGADCVIMQEDVQREGSLIRFSERPRSGRHIRRRSCDLAAGDCVLQSGRILGPREIAAAAAAGQGAMAVRTRLPVELMSTGSELRAAGQVLGPGQIWDVNLPMLEALATQRWIDLQAPQTFPDRMDALVKGFEDASKHARLIVTSGGAAGGDADLVAEAVVAAGGQARSLRLAMKPGKPLVVGRIGSAIVLGLPGNPVAALVAWMVIGLPLARHLAGASTLTPRPCWGTLSRPLQRPPGRREYRPARVVGHDVSGHPVLDLAPKDFSSRIGLLASMDGFAVIPEDSGSLSPGEEVTYLPFEAP